MQSPEADDMDAKLMALMMGDDIDTSKKSTATESKPKATFSFEREKPSFN